MKGRKPKATRLKLLGGAREDRINTPPQAPEGDVTPPKWLKGEALAEWKRTAPGLIEQGLLTPADRPMFVAYCVAWQNYVDATTTLAKQGATYKPRAPRRKKGAKAPAASSLIKRHPACAVQAEAVRQLRLVGERFGLDPWARQRLDVDPRQPEDPLEKLLSRGGQRQA